MSESEAGLVAGQAEEVGEVAGLHSEETAQHQQSAGTGNTAGTGAAITRQESVPLSDCTGKWNRDSSIRKCNSSLQYLE